MNIKLTLIAALGLSLAGCATANTEAKDEFTSSRTPSEIALCMDDMLRGGVRTEMVSTDHVVIERRNTYGMPMVRWDAYATPNGSRIEYRNRMAVNTGMGDAVKCFAGES